MILAKIMDDQLEDAAALFEGRYGVQYGDSSEKSKFIKKIRNAYEKKSLVQLSTLLDENR